MRLIYALLVLPVLLLSCSNNDDKVIDDRNKINIEGTWKSDKFFVSFNNEGRYAAYLDEKFIDSGKYTFDNQSIVTCKNDFNGKNTIYTIKKHVANTIYIDVKYTGFDGSTVNKSLIMNRTDGDVYSRTHILIGKSYTYLSAYEGKKCEMSFLTENSGSLTLKDIRPKKQDWYYIYLPPYVYVQKFKPSNEG